METQQVLDVLKPKAASLGFSEEELKTASETIAGLHPEEAIDHVTTAGGRAIRGLNAMDHTGFNSAVIRSMKAGLQLD